MSSPTASVQLIVFGSRGSDLPGVLADVAKSGFPAIEAGNLFAMHGEAATRHELETHGVRVSGAHFGYGDFADADRLSGHIAYCQSLGLRHLMCSGVADGTVDGYRRSAKLFNDVGRRTADLGIAFRYHNHDWEFKPLEGGVTGMQVLLEETDPAVVKLNIDVFWLYYAGQNPVRFITDHIDRAGYYHFKDGRRVTGEDGKTRPEFLELGRGDVDLKAAIAAALAGGAEWIVAEQDSTKLTPLESLTISRAYMRDHLGV